MAEDMPLSRARGQYGLGQAEGGGWRCCQICSWVCPWAVAAFAVWLEMRAVACCVPGAVTPSGARCSRCRLGLGLGCGWSQGHSAAWSSCLDSWSRLAAQKLDSFRVLQHLGCRRWEPQQTGPPRAPRESLRQPSP